MSVVTWIESIEFPSYPLRQQRPTMIKSYLRSLCIGPFIALGFLSSLPAQEGVKRVVFIAGGPSHDYGSHEHYAGCRILADAIQKSMPQVKCEIIRNGWPKEDQILDTADSIVIYSDGGGGHPANKHLDRLEPLMKKGVGFVCLHYGVEVPKGEVGDKFLQWLGGYFETHWSVNPHWKADFKSFPNHPIARGVSPFQSQDEWYFHMRFQPDMKGVTPILSAIAPPSTMERTDGPHSGNPDVRALLPKGNLNIRLGPMIVRVAVALSGSPVVITIGTGDSPIRSVW